jgi:hypothetical protein
VGEFLCVDLAENFLLPSVGNTGQKRPMWVEGEVSSAASNNCFLWKLFIALLLFFFLSWGDIFVQNTA